MSSANFLAGIEGIPQGTTHIMLRGSNVGFSYSCSVALIKLCDGVWYRHERDSDREYPAFVKASPAWVAANEKFFIDIRNAEQAAPEPATVAVDDSRLLDDLELVAREYMTGFSVVYRHACDGEPGGFVAMRRRIRTEPAPTLREAALRLLEGYE